MIVITKMILEPNVYDKRFQLVSYVPD